MPGQDLRVVMGTHSHYALFLCPELKANYMREMTPQEETALAKLSPEDRKKFEGNKSLLKSVVKKEKESRFKYFPSKNFIPNIGQERALKCLWQRHPTYNDFPETVIDLGGNGTGKTALAVILIIGCTLGRKFLDTKYFNYDYFKELEAIRRVRSLRMRIVCDAADMEESGSFYEQLKQWCPISEFSGKTSGNYYTKIKIPAPSSEFYSTTIDVKTFKQDKVAHAGANLDIIIFNEPAPADIYAENKGRIRVSGKIFMFLTPLDLAGYICDIIEAERPEGQLYYVECPIWDNCKDIPGTRGLLSERKIRDMITDWEATDPTQVPARELGKFQHLAGSIFKLFSEKVHVMDPIAIESDWNIYHIVDPHPVKPAFSLWLALTPLGDVYVIAESPTNNWKTLPNTTLSIKEFGREWRRIEDGKHENFQYIRKLRIHQRIGDPNAFKHTQQHNKKSIQYQYEKDAGFWFDLEDVEQSIILRIDKIRDLLMFDYKRKIDDVNRPRLYVFSSCRNTILALKYFSLKKARSGFTYGSFDETWECPIACLGYGVASMDMWSPNKEEKEDEWEPEREPDRFVVEGEPSSGSIYHKLKEFEF